MIELRRGQWQDVLADVEACDAVISDPPYGARTHDGQRYTQSPGHSRAQREDWASQRGLAYSCMAPDMVREFVASWSPRCAGWICAMTSHDLIAAWEEAFHESGRYTFKPLPIVLKGMNVRLAGDGPSSWSVEMVQAAPLISHAHETDRLLVSRPRSGPCVKWGTLPGAYVGNPFDPGENTATASRKTNVVGSKPIWLMRAIIRDYTKPGDLIVDPFAGSGTTLLAARAEGRSCIGAEVDPETFEKAQARIEKPYTMELFS